MSLSTVGWEKTQVFVLQLRLGRGCVINWRIGRINLMVVLDKGEGINTSWGRHEYLSTVTLIRPAADEKWPKTKHVILREKEGS